MNPRQRNIPVTSKEEIEVQTDVKLIESHLMNSFKQESQLRESHPDMVLSKVYMQSGLLRPFSDNNLLKEFTKSLKELKDSEFNQGTFAKRLEILEEQINGLMKRELLMSSVVEGSETWNSYYSTLNQKEKTIIKLENEKMHSDRKIKRLRERIEQLEIQVDQLRSALVSTQKLGEENKLYASFHEKLNNIINNGKKKGVEFESLLNEQIAPITADFSMNLTALTRSINRDVHASMRSVVNTLAREFDKLLKEQQFTEEKISDFISNLFVNFNAVKGVDHMKKRFDLANKAEIAETNYKNLLSLFKNEIDGLKKEVPSLKAAERIDLLLNRLEIEDIEIIFCNGWMNLIINQIKIIEVNKDDKKLRDLLGILGREFKRIYENFPELKRHLAKKIIAILQSELLIELIQGCSFDSLQSIVITEIEQIRVDNIFKFDNKKEEKKIFHLRVLIKALLEELERVKKIYGVEIALDDGILGLIKELAVDCINIEEIIGLFRPCSKYIEVPVVVDTPVFQTRTFEKGIPIKTEIPILIEQGTVEVVTAQSQVPIFIQVPVEGFSTNNVPVTFEVQKAVPTPIIQEVIVERVVNQTKQVQCIQEKIVTLYDRVEVVKEVYVDKIIEVPEIREKDKIIQVDNTKIIEVEKKVECPYYIYETKQVLKEVEVKVPQIIKQQEFIEIQKVVNVIIEKKEFVNIIEEVPVEIRVPELQFIELKEIRDQTFVTNETIEVVKEIQTIVEKGAVKEVPHEIFIERSHFIKGDVIEVPKQVEILIDKPIIKEILVTADVETDKIVPLYITEQIPVITEVPTPYISEKIKELEVQKIKLVPVRQEVAKQVRVEIPVPVIVEKEIIRVQNVIVEKIVQRIVEVPRVVEIQKIVEKIVVVPRIIEKIIEVPKIIEKIVIIEVPILQIIQIPYPQIIIQEVEKIKEVIIEVQKIVIERVVEFVDRPMVVEKVIEIEKPVEVIVQKRIPFEVVREFPVDCYRDRVQYLKAEIHDVKVEVVQVQVPLFFPEFVPLTIEKPIITEHIIEVPVIEKVYTEKEVPVITEIQKLVVKQVIKEKLVEVQVPFEVIIQKIIYKEIPQIIEVIRDRIVELIDVKEVPKEIFVQTEKIVIEIRDKIREIPINEIVLSPQLIEIPKIVKLTDQKEVAVGVTVREEYVKRDVIQEIKIEKERRDVIVEVEICREKIKEVDRFITQFLNVEVVKDIFKDVIVNHPPQIEVMEVTGPTVVQEIVNNNTNVDVQYEIIERVVEKIIMSPQIVEVIKNIYHISEVNTLGIAVDVDINLQTEKYLGVTTQLKASLLELLGTFKTNVGRQPDLKNLIVVIEKYLKFIEEWILFPKLIEVEKEVIVQVQKQRVVLVPTPDNAKESILAYIIEKLINEIRRLRDSHKVPILLEEQLLKLFFTEKRIEEVMEAKFADYQEILKKRFSNFGEWSDSNPFMINSFLQDHFALTSLIEEANRHQVEQSREIDGLRSKLEIATNKYTNLLCFNRKMFDDNNNLIQTLEKYRSTIDSSEYHESISEHRKFYESILEESQSVMLETIRWTTQHKGSYIRREEEEFIIHGGKGGQGGKKQEVGELIGKLSRYENKTQELESKVKRLENELGKSQQEIKLKSSAIKRLETQFESRVSKVKDDLAKNPNFNKDLIDENKKLQERIRVLEREIATEKANADKAKKELQRSGESQKRDYDRDMDRKQREIKDNYEKVKKQLERDVTKLRSDFQKLRRDKEKVDTELVETKKKSSEEIKVIRENQMSGASDKYNQLLNENVELRRKIDGLESEYDKLKRGALENNSANDREIARLRTENEKYLAERKEAEKHKKIGFMDVTQEAQLVNRNIELEKKIKQLESDLEKYKTKDEVSIAEIKILNERIKKLQIELEIARKEVEAAQASKSRLQSTVYQSGFKQSGIVSEHIESSVARSPRSPTYKSSVIYEKGLSSPQESSMSRQERGVEEFGSSSSRVSQSSEDQGLPPYYNSQMTVREFIDAKHGDEKERDMYITLVMIKVIEKIEEEAERGIFNSYSPSNIYLTNFNTKNLDKLIVKFGPSISNKYNKSDGLYLSPEILAGGSPNRKSTVFCLGVILDELIHGSTFFKSLEDIQNLHNEFKVRGEKLNPILKNTLFQMMNKEPNKRLDVVEAKRRLSLQKYIATESRSALTITSRVGRRITQE